MPPEMSRFRRYDDELALESTRRDARYKWIALCRNHIRAGHVNPEAMGEGYNYHKFILDLVPHFLTISPLDVDYLELLFGFDLECDGNHDEIIYQALYENSPLANLLGSEHGKVLDVQPAFGSTLNEAGNLQVYYEVKSRQKSRRGSSKAYRDQPLSIFITMRKYGPFDDISELPGELKNLAAHAERLTLENLIPNILQPISRYISSPNQ